MDLENTDGLGPIFLGTLTVVILIVLYFYDSSGSRCDSTSVDSDVVAYGYEDCDGPSVWRNKFTSAGGSRQSPINLQDRCAMIIPSETVPPLNFSSEFHTAPYEMKLYNSGHTVIIYATWCGKPPILCGGPLKDDYGFLNIRFRWGSNDDEGSEHMINSTKYAMELQAAFIKCGCKHKDVVQAAKNGSLLFLSYLFLVTPRDNPYMEPIVNSLRYLKYPCSCIPIDPIILSLLTPTFSRDYYCYTGSLSYPPCSEGVKWIIKPEPLLISSNQVRKFRKLCGHTGLLLDNTRPVQKICKREIMYYD